MNGIHDMGGMTSFGPVRPEANEPVFHADWEKRVLAINVAAGACGAWNIDMSRHAREDRPPAEYLGISYYEIWLAGLERVVVETGLVSALELATGDKLLPPKAVKPALKAEDVEARLLAGWPADRALPFKPRFEPGQRVRTRVASPAGHTRLPRYARGRPGVIHAWHGAHVFPDANAHGHGEAPHHLYTVRFAAADLWGADTTADEVYLDCWEPYLDAAAT
jgi:nitrile hydratase